MQWKWSRMKKDKTKIRHRKSAVVKPSWAAELGSFPHDAVWQHFQLGEPVPSPSLTGARDQWAGDRLHMLVAPAVQGGSDTALKTFWALELTAREPSLLPADTAGRPVFRYYQSWWRFGSPGLPPIAAFHMKWPKHEESQNIYWICVESRLTRSLMCEKLFGRPSRPEMGNAKALWNCKAQHITGKWKLQ